MALFLFSYNWNSNFKLLWITCLGKTSSRGVEQRNWGNSKKKKEREEPLGCSMRPHSSIQYSCANEDLRCSRRSPVLYYFSGVLCATILKFLDEFQSFIHKVLLTKNVSTCSLKVTHYFIDMYYTFHYNISWSVIPKKVFRL